MKTVVVRHEQIGTDEEAGTDPKSARDEPIRDNNPADFGAKQVVPTIWREIPHLFKVGSTDDIIWDPLIFSVALDIRFPFSGWDVKGSHRYKVLVSEPVVGISEPAVEIRESTVFISEPVCQTKGNQTENAY